MNPPAALGEFIADLDQASIATRYPEELAVIQAAYSRPMAEEIITKAREVIVWAKKML